jgi:hypothetical protein
MLGINIKFYRQIVAVRHAVFSRQNNNETKFDVSHLRISDKTAINI